MKKKIGVLILVVLLIILIFLYTIFFRIDINKAENYYQNYQFYNSGEECNDFNSFFNKKLRKYKIARIYGSTYQYYKENVEKYGKNNEKYIQKNLESLVIQVYWINRDSTDNINKFSNEEKEVIEYIKNLYYTAFENDFGISKDKIDSIIKKYNTGNEYTDCQNIREELEIFAKEIVTSSKEKANTEKNPIEISNTKLSTNSLYNVLEGSVTNKGNKTIYFVKVKVSFMDDLKKTIDTEWTYAVGSEGLAPGESKKFEVSVKKDSSITYAYPNVIDFNY